jgi:hypothetical protein
MAMTKENKRVPSLQCDMCRRVFRHGDKPECGALVVGKKWCDPNVLRRELEDRLMPEEELKQR